MSVKLQILKGALIRTLHVLIRRDCAPFNGAFEQNDSNKTVMGKSKL